VFSYSKLDGKGLPSKRIVDVQTSSGDISAADDPNTIWGITETGTGLHIATNYAYDAQGRLDSTTLPSGRITKMYYTKLKDGRMVTISIPRVAGGKYHGPASYTVTNHAGGTEFSGTIAIATAGVSTALASWVSTSSSADPLVALDQATIGPVSSLATSVYIDAGTKLSESRSYFLIPGSGAGSAGTNYDATVFGYDPMGRRWRSKSADGTIGRTVFDLLGRATESWTGTNDAGFFDFLVAFFAGC